MVWYGINIKNTFLPNRKFNNYISKFFFFMFVPRIQAFMPRSLKSTGPLTRLLWRRITFSVRYARRRSLKTGKSIARLVFFELAFTGYVRLGTGDGL